MKKFLTYLSALLLLLVASCTKEQKVVKPIYADKTEITGVAYKNPAPEPIVITTDAAYWIVIAPDWITPDPVTAPGGGSSICTLTIKDNYVNENTDVAARVGEVVFSGGNSKLIVTVSQNGYTAPVDPEKSIGGIPDITEFKKFINNVNNGGKLTRWMNEAGEVQLLDNLDLAGFGDWTPIGVPSSLKNDNYLSTVEGPVFTGKFNGAGHTISNFDLTVKDAADLSTYGFFGVLKGAEVKNLKLKGNMNVSAAGTSDIGFLAGTVISSKISDITVEFSVTSKGSSANKRFALGGIAGYMFSDTDKESTISNCTVTGNVNADCGSNTGNGAIGCMYGGIVGFATAPKDATGHNYIDNCVCNGEFVMKYGRASGICASSNCGSILRKCTNNANQVNTITNGRLGNVISMLAVRSGIEDCVNNGNLTTSADQSTTAGALVALISGDDCYIKGGKNTGTIIGGSKTYTGLIGANLSKFASIADVTVSGAIGYFKEDGNHEMVALTEDNYQQYIGSVSDANRAKISGLKFEGTTPPVVKGIASAADLTEFATLVSTGGDYSKFMDGDAVVLVANIDLGGAEWAPIGPGNVSTAGVIAEGSKPFTGIFDGKGHTIDNFKVTVGADAAKEIAAGLFGVLNGATVKNVVIGSKAVISGESKAASYLGGVAGFIVNSTVDACINYGTVSLKAATTNIRECAAGIVGEMYTLAESKCTISNCENWGVVSSKNDVNEKNGATGLSVAGICGFSDGKELCYVQNCTNKVAITAAATRLAGIVGSANSNTKVDGCVNEGKIKGTDIKATNSRIGGIVSAASAGVIIASCINRGEVTFIEGYPERGYAAGILGQANADLEISGCENHAAILSDIVKHTEPYIGAIIGNPNTKTVTIKNCKVGGSVGPAVETAEYKVVVLTSENFADYISAAPATKKTKWVLEGNTCGN